MGTVRSRHDLLPRAAGASSGSCMSAVSSVDERFRLVCELGTTFASRLELDELIPLVIARCRDALQAEGVAVLLLNDERSAFTFPYIADTDPEVARRATGLHFPVSMGIAGLALAGERALRIDDVANEPNFYPEIDRATGLTTRNLIAVPLQTRHGPLGVLEVLNHRTPPGFTDEDFELIVALAPSIANAIENARLWDRLKMSADGFRAEVSVLRRDLARRDRFSEIIGASAAMERVFRLMESAAASPIAVILQGETGTGKESVARGIHRTSSRANQPFVAINCAALPENLLESELFGFRQGSFTGASRDQRGLFEAAGGGTIFLDEIGEMPFSMQAKLLRVLQEGEVMPIGDRHPRRVDVRVISATNQDLPAAIAARTFREDLFYRLNAFPIVLPPLRDRADDIPLLADHFIRNAAARHHKGITGITKDALARLMRFTWPGNVRELQNEIERAVALGAPGTAIDVTHLSEKVALCPRDAASVPHLLDGLADAPNSLRAARTLFERDFVRGVLAEHDGNVSHAAVALGITRVALQRKMKDLQLR